MSDNRKIFLQLGRSRLLELYIIISHLAAFASLVWCAWVQPCVIALMPLIGISAYYHWRIQGSRSAPGAVRRVELLANGEWCLTENSGKSMRLELSNRNFVAPSLTVLTFHRGRFGRRHLVLLNDNCDAAQLRRLRVWMRMNANGSVAERKFRGKVVG